MVGKSCTGRGKLHQQAGTAPEWLFERWQRPVEEATNSILIGQEI